MPDLPCVYEGEGFGIVEDVGGIPGLEEIARALKKGSGKKYDDFCAWFGSITLNLEAFDKDDMNFRLKKLIRVYKEIYEYHYTPTDRMVKVLNREYLGKGSRG
ncbi:MAG: plasmid pRiA4b ORF-3 family protein [Actinomycetia bacterium]|nr:plasmid pRiA4b ORF-3 family protein [Actinomycetes bacterium]